MHHDWLPETDDANQTYHPFYLPRPEEIEAKTRAIRNGELFVLPNGQAVEGELARKLHRQNKDNIKKRVRNVIRVEIANGKVAEKQCSKCRRVLVVNSFHVNVRKHDGLQNTCKECKHKEAMRRQEAVA